MNPDIDSVNCNVSSAVKNVIVGSFLMLLAGAHRGRCSRMETLYNFKALAKRYNFDSEKTPWNNISPEAQNAFLFGDPKPLQVEFQNKVTIRRQKFPGFYTLDQSIQNNNLQRSPILAVLKSLQNIGIACTEEKMTHQCATAKARLLGIAQIWDEPIRSEALKRLWVVISHIY